jgi:hypothetical protein
LWDINYKPIDWRCNWRQPKCEFIKCDTHATCVVNLYFFFSIDSSEARKNMYMPDMQTINYALDRTHFFISILPIFKRQSFARHRQFTLLGFRTVSWTNRNILFDVIDTWFQILFTMWCHALSYLVPEVSIKLEDTIC